MKKQFPIRSVDTDLPTMRSKISNLQTLAVARCLFITAWCIFLSHTSRAEELEAFTEPYHRVAVPAPEIGVLAELLVKEGDIVKQKQLLARLDDAVLESSLEVAKAAKNAVGAIKSAEAELAMRERQLRGYRELQDNGNASHRELERAESDFWQATSRLTTVREELEVRRLEFERVKTQLERRRIESPIDGIVIAIEKAAGEFVSPTDPVVMQVVHLETLKVVFSVPLQVATSLAAGQAVTLLVGHNRQPCQGVIEFVSPVVHAESNSVRVKLRIPNADLKLQSGVVCHWSVNGGSLPTKSGLEQQSNPEKTTRLPSGRFIAR